MSILQPFDVDNPNELRDVICNGGFVMLGGRPVLPGAIVQIKQIGPTVYEYYLADMSVIEVDEADDPDGVSPLLRRLWTVAVRTSAARPLPEPPSVRRVSGYDFIGMDNGALSDGLVPFNVNEHGSSGGFEFEANGGAGVIEDYGLQVSLNVGVSGGAPMFRGYPEVGIMGGFTILLQRVITAGFQDTEYGSLFHWSGGGGISWLQLNLRGSGQRINFRFKDDLGAAVVDEEYNLAMANNIAVSVGGDGYLRLVMGSAVLWEGASGAPGDIPLGSYMFFGEPSSDGGAIYLDGFFLIEGVLSPEEVGSYGE